MSRKDPPLEDATPQDVDMTDAGPRPPPSSTQHKRRKTPKQTTLSQFTIRQPHWSYIHLSRVSPSATIPTLDALTTQIQLQAALSSFLGLHGTAIPLDFLKIEGQSVWVRCPRQDVSAVLAAVGGWVGKSGEGWRVVGWSCWGPDVGGEGGMDLFDE